MPEVGVELVADHGLHDGLVSHVHVHEPIAVNVAAVGAAPLGTVHHDNALIIEPDCVEAVDVGLFLDHHGALEDGQGVYGSHLPPLDGGSEVVFHYENEGLAPGIVDRFEMKVFESLKASVLLGHLLKLLSQMHKIRGFGREREIEVKACEEVVDIVSLEFAYCDWEVVEARERGMAGGNGLCILREDRRQDKQQKEIFHNNYEDSFGPPQFIP